MAWQTVENYDKGGLTMASCKDCLHVDVCKNRDIFVDMPICEHFKDRNRFVELYNKRGENNG